MTNNSFKLFVDDMRPIPAGWLGARTVSEAISVLANLRISEVSLDHDIIMPISGNSLYQPLLSETYKGVAYYIALIPINERPNVIIHTANVGAARTLCDILQIDFNKAYKFYDPKNYE